MNAKMPELKKAFEAAGFTDVKTVLSSGNVVFSAPAAPEAALERKAEATMAKRLGNAFGEVTWERIPRPFPAGARGCMATPA